jgi:hypothetical protein
VCHTQEVQLDLVGGQGDLGGAIRVTAAQLTAALDQLLDSRSQLTRTLLDGQPK